MRRAIQLKAFNVSPVKQKEPDRIEHKGSTYKRKYYLHRRVKASGFILHLERCAKTININEHEVVTAKENKYVTELQNKFGYGVQILNSEMP